MLQKSETRIELLENTINHFNYLNRSIAPNGTCRYRYNSKGCAIGRELDDELAIKLDNNPSPYISNIEIYNLLPNRLRKMGQNFLQSIQSLHDEENWDYKGLNSNGKLMLVSIKKQYKL